MGGGGGRLMSGLMVDWLHVISDNKQASVCVLGG